MKILWKRLLWKLVGINYGFSCGRHWISIRGLVIAQTPGDDFWMRDEQVCKLGHTLGFPEWNDCYDDGNDRSWFR